MSQTITIIKGLDRDKIIRPEYGQTSLKSWVPVFDDMQNKFDFILKYWSQVNVNTNQEVQSALTSIHGQLMELIGFSESHFVSRRQNVIGQIANDFNIIKKHWPHYVIAAIDDSGLLLNLDFKKEFETFKNDLDKLTKDAKKDIKSESQKIINQAKNEAGKIESLARKTAQKISVKEAQDQFEAAASNNVTNIKIWGGITIGLIIVFSVLVICMLFVELDSDDTWEIIYHSVLRLTIIAFVGTLLAFCLKILRSHLHMKEHNLHRQRIANSMASFAESATNQEQRDIILSRLVDSVATFGNSGMIGNDEDGSSKITIDNITRTLSALRTGGD